MRLAAISRFVPGPLDVRVARQLRQRAAAIPEAGGESGDISSFVAFVLEEVCGLDASTGTWTRGSNLSPSWGRRAITGETVKPRHLWTGRDGGRLPVFLDDGRRLGVGRGRRGVSRVLGWAPSAGGEEPRHGRSGPDQCCVARACSSDQPSHSLCLKALGPRCLALAAGAAL